MYKILTAIVFGAAIIGATVWKNSPNEKQVETEHIPAFHRGDCFELLVDKESWEHFSTPDGIVERVGNKSYLVFNRAEAERRGSKYGVSMPIVTLDQNAKQVVCPETWVKHTHERK